MNVNIIHETGDIIGEGPLWHPRKPEMWWVNIEDGLVHSWSEANGYKLILKADYRIGAYAFTQTDDLILATERGIERWHAASDEFELLHELKGDVPIRFNDGAVDPQGRFWIGTMPLNESDFADCHGKLYRFDPDRSLHLMDEGFTISNGMDWSNDGKTMLFTDTLKFSIYAYDFDGKTGAISNRRTFIKSDPKIGSPDGLTYDAEGYIWSAYYNGHGLYRYTPSGEIDGYFELGTQSPTSMAFGGDDLGTLFITSARHHLEPGDIDPKAGSLITVTPNVKGRPSNVFAG